MTDYRTTYSGWAQLCGRYPINEGSKTVEETTDEERKEAVRALIKEHLRMIRVSIANIQLRIVDLNRLMDEL